MLYNTFDDTIMESIGWLFEVLSGVLYLPFQFNEDTIIAGLIVITPIAAGALCLIIDWVFDVRDEFSNFHRLEDYTSSFRQHFQRYGRPRQSRVDLKALKEYQDYKHKQAMELQEKKHTYTHDYLQQQMAHTKIKNAMQTEQSTRFSQNIDKLKNYQEYKAGRQGGCGPPPALLLRTNRKRSMALLFLLVTTLSWILRWIEHMTYRDYKERRKCNACLSC